MVAGPSCCGGRAAHLLGMSITAARVPAGVRSGGQFTTTTRAEPHLALASLLAREPADHAYDPALVAPRRLRDGEHLIAQAAEVGGVTLVNGHPHAKAANRAVAARLQRRGGMDLEDELEDLARQRRQVSLLMSNDAGVVRAHEGTLHRTAIGNLALMNKGDRSGKGVLIYRADNRSWRQRALALEQGYGHLDDLAETWRQAAAATPSLAPADFEGIPDCGSEEPPSEVAAVFSYTHPGFESDQDGPGSMFFATDVQSDQDGNPLVVNGYAIHPGDLGLSSEHGSMYASDLRAMGGRVAGFLAGSMTFREVADLGRRAEWGNDIEAAWDRVAELSGR